MKFTWKITTITPLCLALTVLLSILSAASAAEGGSMAGGGGSGLLCFHQESDANLVRARNGAVPNSLLSAEKIASLETFDLYHARLPQGLSGKAPALITPDADESVESLVKRINKRIQYASQDIASFIGSVESHFKEDQIHLVPAPLRYDADEGTEISFASGACALVPIAKQENRGGSWSLVIDSRLYNHPLMINLSRATLLLHEAVYARLRKQGATDSSSTRKFVAMALQDREAHAWEFNGQSCELLGYKTFWREAQHDSAFGAKLCGGIDSDFRPRRELFHAVRRALHEQGVSFWLDISHDLIAPDDVRLTKAKKMEKVLLSKFEAVFAEQTAWDKLLTAEQKKQMRAAGTEILQQIVQLFRQPLAEEQLERQRASRQSPQVLSFTSVDVEGILDFSPYVSFHPEQKRLQKNATTWLDEMSWNMMVKNGFNSQDVMVPGYAVR